MPKTKKGYTIEEEYPTTAEEMKKYIDKLLRAIRNPDNKATKQQDK